MEIYISMTSEILLFWFETGMFFPNLEWIPSNLVAEWITWSKHVVTWLYLDARIGNSWRTEKISVTGNFFCPGFSVSFSYSDLILLVDIASNTETNISLCEESKDIFLATLLSNLSILNTTKLLNSWILEDQEK